MPPFLNTMEKIRKTLDKIVDVVVVILFIVIFAVVLLQIFFRYVLNSPLVWSEELSRYLFIWISFLGWTLATRHKTHIRVEFVLNALPKKVQFIVKVITHLIVIFFIGMLIYLGMRMALRSVDVPTVSLFFTYAYIYAIVPVASAIILFYTILDFIDLFRKEEISR